jgi:hypothetical protein
VVDQMSQIWGNGAGPDLIEVCAPFWAAPVSGRNPVVVALSERMILRGDREVRVLAPGERDANGAWMLDAPKGAFEHHHTGRPLGVEIHAVPAAQQNEHRPLHAKIQRWSRETGGELVLVGSSNATEAGLGLATARNIEANLCFVGDGERSTRVAFNALFPHAERATGNLSYHERQVAEEGSNAPAASAFFAWAELSRESDRSKLVVGFDLEEREPDGWNLGLSGEVILTAERHRERGRPAEVTFDLPGDRMPFAVEVLWLENGEARSSEIPVNAADEASRADSTLRAELDLDTVLDTLASGLPLWRRLVEVASRSKKAQGTSQRAELDPHRRVDTSAFLMQRMRRISRALEGLRERLAAPVATPSSLEWRFQGPLGPVRIARLLAGSLDGPSDVVFVLAELALVVARASETVRADGLDQEAVDGRFRVAVDELASMKPALDGDAVLESYFDRAFTRARRSIGRRAPTTDVSTEAEVAT